MSNLTPEQEEKSITETAFLELITGEKSPKNPFAKAVWDTLERNGYKISRIYHTEASKAGVSGEVKSAREIFQKHTSHISLGGVSADIIRAMREYAAQFENRWQSMDSAPKDGNYVTVGYYGITGDWLTHQAFYSSSLCKWVNSTGIQIEPTHFLPHPPKPSK